MANQWAGLANQYGAQYAVPPALILALIDMESGGDPNNVNPASNATGLMQVTRTVLNDYNTRHNLKLTLEDVKDPASNIRIGTELLKRISLAYEKNNQIKPDWSNPAYAGLIVLGWNAGYSRAAGVSYVLSRMEVAGIPRSQWNVDSVHESALKLDKAVQFLKMPNRVAWTHRVVKRYLGIESDASKRVAKASGKEWSTGKKVLVYGGVGAGVLGLGYYFLTRNSDSGEEIDERPALPVMPQIIVVK